MRDWILIRRAGNGWVGFVVENRHCVDIIAGTMETVAKGVRAWQRRPPVYIEIPLTEDTAG